jgi:U3 small nucleolar RNA-associated protein 18
MVDTGADNLDVEEEEQEEEEEEEEESESESESSIDLPSDDGDIHSEQENDDASGSDTAHKTERRRPVWTDPGSSNLNISLAGSKAGAANGSSAGTKKLRKLRQEEGETQITGAEYELRLRKVFEKYHPRPSWASLSLRKPATVFDGESSQNQGREALSDLLSRDTGLVSRLTKRGSKTKGRLPKDRVEVERLRNANEAQGRATFSSIESLSFHPTTKAHVLMTTTKDRRLRLFQVDGNTNPLLETLHIPDLPLQSALFHPSGSSILLSGPRPFFYSHDLESGRTIKSTPWRGFGSSAHGAEEKDLSTVCFQKTAGVEDNRSILAIGGRRGAIHLLEWGSVGGSGGGSLIGSLHMNAPLAGLTWDSSRSNSLVSLSTFGTVHSWDVRNMKCEVQKSDAGLFNPKGVKGSPRGDSWAIGSENGIVNMYDGQTMISDSKTSTMSCQKSIKNVTTTTSTLQYNHTGEILAVGSDKKKDMLKFVSEPRRETFLPLLLG